MSADARGRAPTYDVTVRGALGPVLRNELGRSVDAISDPRTVLRLNADEGVGLVGLLVALESSDADVVDVRAEPRRRRGRGSGITPPG
jgi:hypothetical protein